MIRRTSSYGIGGGGASSYSWMKLLFPLAVAICAFIIYAMTAFRNIDWWFGSSYTLSAVTFGVNSPPGSLMLTILGWIVSRLTLGISQAFTLNIFAGAIGSLACLLAAMLGFKLLQHREYSADVRSGSALAATLAGVIAGVLYLSFSDAIWRYSIIFMPYILTALFTVIILWAIFEWWRREAAGARSDKRLFLVLLLFGLDFSVHRTNLLMLPGFLLWILIVMPGIYRRATAWAFGAMGLILGLAFHLLVMPMAARGPALNFGDPSTWRRFYEYISLQQYGGSWLVNMWPRNAALANQLKSYVGDLSNNFFSYSGPLAAVPIILFLAGIVALGRRDSRLFIGYVIMLLCASIGAVIFFNVPDQYIFPMDRHYIPSFVISGLFIAIGAGAMMRAAMRPGGGLRFLAVPIALILAFSMPVKQLTSNYHRLDGSDNFFGYDFARNILSTVQPDAIVIVQGDNYWVARGLQILEGMRPDVTVLSQTLLNVDWYIEQIMEYGDLPLGLTGEEIEALAPVPWQDTTIVTLVEGGPEIYELWKDIKSHVYEEAGEAGDQEAGMPVEYAALPDTFAITVPPSIPGGPLLIGDQVIVRMIERNRWRRPIYFTIPPNWLTRYSRIEGIVWLLVPQDPPVINIDLLRENLLEKYSIRGYADVTPPISVYTNGNGNNLQIAFYYLASGEAALGDSTACRETAEMLEELVPLDIIEPQPSVREAIERLRE